MRDRYPCDPSNAARAGAAIALIALALIALAGAGCGGGGGSSSTASSLGAGTTNSTASVTATSPASPKPPAEGKARTAPGAGIRAALRAVLASTDPAEACARFVTPDYLRTTYGDRQGCIAAQVPGSVARSVAVSEVRVSGSAATATAVPAGGPSSGERIRAHLLLAHGVWKVDSLHSNAPVGP